MYWAPQRIQTLSIHLWCVRGYFTKSLVQGNMSKCNKQLASLVASCKFHDYISWKASTMGKKVVNQEEKYTTKTCYRCGTLTEIGVSKEYNCGSCHFKCDRDANSALNILTKFMGTQSL